jgi:hypothetical protein
MSNQLNLKELEQKAFRSIYQDGLLDIYLGLIVICMTYFMFRPQEGYGAWNIFLMLACVGLAYSVFWAGKKYVTLPRMGQVTFGPLRRRKKITLAFLLGAIVAVQVVIVLLSMKGWLNADYGGKLSTLFGEQILERLIVAELGSFFVGPAMILIAYFKDFPRGYYIGILIALAVFLMILFNQPVYPLLIGVLIIIPGLVLFVRFLRKYPLQRGDVSNE